MFTNRRSLLIQISATPSVHELTVGGTNKVTAETFNMIALYDGETDVTNLVFWAITNGNQYAVINNAGEVTINSGVSEEEITIQATYNNLVAIQNVIITYKSGSSSHTESETITDYSGNTTTTVTTITENEDGSSTSSSNSVTYDKSGNTIGSETTNIIVNSDGSSSSSAIRYNENGDPIDGLNKIIDVDGNNSSQEVEYDDSGNTIVTGYEIDTSGNPNGEKTFDGDGVNTEFYGFDMTCGFNLNIHFTIDFTDQPAGQDQNHHQILSMKRATPDPWYGFQLRQSSTNKYVQLGTQFQLGGNTNTNVPVGRQLSTNVYEYDIQILYDASAVFDNFVAKELISNKTFFTSSDVFPDIPELKYLTICIGYALDGDSHPYRYSNINVLNFSVVKICKSLENPVIECDGKHVAIICETLGSEIYYRLNETGDYSKYTSAITISADTVVEAYSMLGSKTSEIVTETCIYDAIEDPVISCDGEEITISCEEPSANIFYRLNETGNYLPYIDTIAITADTVIEAYAQLDNKVSDTVKQTCIYIPSSLVAPVISCDGMEITITCLTPNASIYYQLDQTGGYALYTTPIAITADTVVETYSELSGDVSTLVIENCLYNPTHDYSEDYLTFRIISGGTITWSAFGSGYDKVIEYSINNGNWISITATTTPSTFSVSVNNTVRFRGTNTTYAGSKSNYDGFEGGTAIFNIEGNIMSLVYGDNFIGNTGLTGTYNFCSIFKKTNVISAENLILPSNTLTRYCYRAMFSYATTLTNAPALPATTLAQGCYWYMFEQCGISSAPELNATTLVKECYGNMFNGCGSLNYIKCIATDGFSTTSALTNWVSGVAASGSFVKDENTSWITGNSGIPNGWIVYNGDMLFAPEIYYDGDQTVTLTCATYGADIYYNLNQTRSYTLYTEPILIDENTTVEAYSAKGNASSTTVSETCIYVDEIPYSGSNKTIASWKYNNVQIETPYSVNAIDGHSSSYAKGTFNFETTISLRKVQPTYLWFQHADQSANIYVDNVLVETHWGGYNAFFSDITNYIHRGTNKIKVALCNTTRSNLAPAAGDFNFNATLGDVKYYTSPVYPIVTSAFTYGYDGFHVTSDVSSSAATVNVKTTIPSGATVVCSINDGNYFYSETGNSTGEEMIFTDIIEDNQTNDLHLWDGVNDPHLYNITLEIYKDGDLYHRFVRPYGLRYYDYVINDNTILSGHTPYTGFLLNGKPYYLRGVCMHDDVDEKANALTETDYDNEFNIIQELGCNFIRLAHYPHPKEVYDRCDQLGIIVQTEVPCVNKFQSTMPLDYYNHLERQYRDMVEQHYNHSCIMFWGLSNETSTDDKAFAKNKIEEYTSLIKSLDQERKVGYVMSHSYNNPAGYYNDPNVDWFGSNIYVGWYIDKATNDPSSQIETRIGNTITRLNKPLAFSEYGCGGTQHCHSESAQTTTTKGNYARHDIEYQMWLHEGHIEAIRNFPELLFTAQWQLFDIAVSNRNEGYTICLDGETTSTDDNLRRLNNKGLVERDHITKKDTFYLYKAEWNKTDEFVHICGKDYTRKTDRAIKCYSNDGPTFILYVNGIEKDRKTISGNIVEFDRQNFNSGDTIVVEGTTSSDTFTFE